MKTFLSFLCTIILVLAQVGSSSVIDPLLPAAATPCRCCDCQQTGCCVTEASPDRPGGPAVPSPVLRHADFQALSFELPRFLLPLLPAPDPAPRAVAEAPEAGVVPLFARDCALLL